MRNSILFVVHIYNIYVRNYLMYQRKNILKKLWSTLLSFVIELNVIPILATLNYRGHIKHLFFVRSVFQNT